MSENKINEMIGEIIHMACQAELVEDEQIKRQALGDIYDAIASVLPVDNRSARSGVRALPSDGAARNGVRALPSDGRAGARPSAASGCRPRLGSPADSEQQRLEAFKARKIHWQMFGTKVDIAEMGRTRQNGKVYEIRIMKRKDANHATDFFCNVNGTTVLEGNFSGSAWMIRKMLKRAMQALVNEKARRCRQNNRAKKRRAASLAPALELAATVARQIDDDELANIIENS